jgi:hypothetical protein
MVTPVSSLFGVAGLNTSEIDWEAVDLVFSDCTDSKAFTEPNATEASVML